MNIVLVGPPGTGKGTAAKLVEQKFGLKHISAGDLLREEVKNGTVLGKKAEPIMRAGKLVDDSLVAEIVSLNVLKNIKKGVILDGFPRNVNQAQILEKLFKEKKIKIDAVLLIESSDELIIKRLGARRQCPECNVIYGLNIPPRAVGKCDHDGSVLVVREDDRPEVVKKRLLLYHEIADPLLGFYRKKGLVMKVNGNQEVQNVFGDISKKIAGLKK